MKRGTSRVKQGTTWVACWKTNARAQNLPSRLNLFHCCKWRSPWSLDAGAPSGVACAPHERCLDAESGAGRRGAAAPDPSDGILRELSFHRARAERSGALARWYVQLHRGVTDGEGDRSTLNLATFSNTLELSWENQMMFITILLGRSGAPHLCEELSPDSFLPLGASVSRTTSHLSKPRWSRPPHSAGPRQCSKLPLT